MRSSFFKKSIFLSLLGHLTVFGLFSFSFGSKLPAANYANISFWGGILNSYDLSLASNKIAARQSVLDAFMKVPRITSAASAEKKENSDQLLSIAYLKPYAFLALNNEKQIFSHDLSVGSIPKKRKESVVTFYPELPYYFGLYFKDMQVAHIELEYNVSSGNKKNITLRRKISSGNLEADLLSMRYIGHYLSIQRERFVPNKWRAVKIELGQKK